MIRRTAKRNCSKNSSRQRRDGVTLTEVLMSLLVVGVGVSSLAVLFPLAILRSIESTQLTSSTIHRYNAEELIDSFPHLPFDPDGDGDAQEHATFNYVVDPWGYDVLTTLSGLGPLASPPEPVEFDGSSPVRFGGMLPRFPGSLVSGVPIAPAAAAPIVTMPDSWETILGKDAVLSAFDNTVTVGPPTTPSINMAGAFAATDLAAAYVAGPGEPVYRAIFFDVTGTISHTRILTNIELDSTLRWSDPLPRFDTDGDGTPDTDFQPATAWLQVQEQHYSWLLTVRRETSNEFDPGPPQITDEIASIDVVVFFNRGIVNTEILTTPPALPGGLAYDPLAENAYALEAPGFQLGRDEVTIDWGTNPKPFLKEGKFIFDPENARWYRILGITELGPTRVQLDLDRGADSDSVFEDVPQGKKGFGVFMRGIVDIYPIIDKTGRFTTP